MFVWPLFWPSFCPSIFLSRCFFISFPVIFSFLFPVIVVRSLVHLFLSYSYLMLFAHLFICFFLIPSYCCSLINPFVSFLLPVIVHSLVHLFLSGVSYNSFPNLLSQSFFFFSAKTALSIAGNENKVDWC